ncbi:MAG: 4-alpha-glucanotransferase [Pseudomonadota bacterium]
MQSKKDDGTECQLADDIERGVCVNRPDLTQRAQAAGVALRYTDNTGRRQNVPDESIRAALLALDAANSADALPDVRVIPADRAGAGGIRGEWQIKLEDRSSLEGSGPLPKLPAGRHFALLNGRKTWLIAAPQALTLPAPGWGVTVPLYGLAGPEAGLGDYADLAETAAALGHLGASFIGINPVHAGVGADPGRISPYSPSHRRRLATAHIRPPVIRSGSGSGLIDYAEEMAWRRAALETVFTEDRNAPPFLAWRSAQGDPLERFATYQALEERFGPGWNRWPAPFQDPESPEVARFAEECRDRRSFQAWLQFMAEDQLAAAARAAKGMGMAHGLYLDLAVGTDPHGAETWAERGSFAYGVSLGAPPDAFSETGQNWSIAPFNPRALIRDGFEALAATLRAQLRYAGMIRIDHILGFDRAFWVPEGLPGTYVKMPREAMLAVLRIEAARAGAVIVGEDLGNVPSGLREALAKSGVLGCQVAMFEPERAGRDYPEATLASFGTHDLPTWLGWQAGRDIDIRERLGLMSGTDAKKAHAARKKDVSALQSHLSGTGADDLHRFLAASRARLVAVQAEDVLDVADQPNLPGTIDAYPNWRRPLPVRGADLGDDPRVIHVAKTMRAADR